MAEMERRVQVTELRTVDPQNEGELPTIRGYAAVFNSMSEDLGGFREFIRPGAFAKTIKEADVRALWNHDPNYVLGRSRSGTLLMNEDERGLAIEIRPPDVQWARDLITSMKRGDVDQMSFGFLTVRDEWNQDQDGNVTRELVECKLFDVSPVTYPAYPATTVQARNIFQQHKAATPDPETHLADGESLKMLRRKLDLKAKTI